MAGFTTFTSEQIAAAPLLEPAFEITLRAADVSDDVMTRFRVHKIKSASTFAAMDTTEALDVDTVKYRLPHKVELANIHNAWMAAKVSLEEKRRWMRSRAPTGNPSNSCAVEDPIRDEYPPRQTPSSKLLRVVRRKTSQRDHRGRDTSLRGELTARTRADLFQTRAVRTDGYASRRDNVSTNQKEIHVVMPTDPESLRTKYRVVTKLW